MICANGAAAHLIRPGDLVIIATFTWMAEVPEGYEPTVVRVDEKNRPVESEAELAGPARR